jgi:hypothetical protein
MQKKRIPDKENIILLPVDSAGVEKTWPEKAEKKFFQRRSPCPSVREFGCLRDFPACPDCGGVVGVVEDAPSDASSDVDLPPLGGTSGDDYSD